MNIKTCFFVSSFVTLIFAVFFLLLAANQVMSPTGALGVYKERLFQKWKCCRESLETYQSEFGEYPENFEQWTQVKNLKNQDTDFRFIFQDPWGNPLKYERVPASDSWRIRCLGADGKPRGLGVNADLVFRRDETFETFMKRFPRTTWTEILREETFPAGGIFLASVLNGILTFLILRNAKTRSEMKNAFVSLFLLFLTSLFVCSSLIFVETVDSGH